TSGTTTVDGNLTVSAGTFTHNAGTLSLTSNNAQTLNSGAAVFNNVVINKTACCGGSDVTVTGTMIVAGNLTLTAVQRIMGGTIAVAGNVTTSATGVAVATGTILFNGSGPQILSAGGGSGTLPAAVSINKPLGTLTIQDTINVSAGWSWTAGSVDAGTSTTVFAGDNGRTLNAGSMAFNNVTINMPYCCGGGTVTVSGTMTVGGNFSLIGAQTINGGTIAIAGHLTSTDTDGISGTTAITLNGTSAQTITTGTGDLPDGAFTINKISGTATLAANLTLNSAGQDLTIASGTLDLAGFNLTLTGAGDVLTVNNGGTLQLQGGETITATTKTLNSGSTVIYNGAGAYGSLLLGNSYHHLTFNGSGSWAHSGTLDVNGNLTITAGTVNSSGQNITLAGNWSNSGTYTSGGNTVTLDGVNQTLTGSTTFSNLTKSVGTADTLTLAASSTTTINGLATLNGAAGQLLSLRSSSSPTRWNLNLAGTKSISYVDVQD
ncbi:MAG: autotransporter-associated beta strand repeat-containing protein, partial [Halothiobacillaceae bacterium]